MSSKIIFLCLKTYARSCTFSNQVFRPEKRKLRADTVYIFLNFDLNREYIGISCLPNLCTPLSTTCMLTTEKSAHFYSKFAEYLRRTAVSVRETLHELDAEANQPRSPSEGSVSTTRKRFRDVQEIMHRSSCAVFSCYQNY
jgi:hypothetical protein